MKDAPLEALPDRFESAQEETMAKDITCASPTHVQTVRYGLSDIHHLLEEEDAASDSKDDSLSFGKLVAYHAKAAEFASIVKEDSPGLSLNLSFEALLGTSSVPEERPWNLQYPVAKGPCLLAPDHAAQFSETQMNISRPPQNLAIPTPCISSKFLNLPIWTSQEGEEEVGSADAIRAVHVNFGRRREKDRRMMCALRPRKENIQKVIGMTEMCHGFVDLKGMLLECAHAIGSSNTKAAKEILVKVKQHASQFGNGEQRMAYYFAEALDARLAGTGWQIYLGNVGYTPKQVWKASWVYTSSCPFAKAFCFFANQIILDVAKGASTLHIREHQLTGFLYPSLFKALAARPGGPPQVRLTGVNTPHYSMASIQVEEVLERLEKTGRQIAACAASYGVPFHFTAWAGEIGAFPFQNCVSPSRSRDEVFVVVSVYPFRYINYDFLNPPMKRFEIIKGMLAVNPEAYIQGIVSGSYNTPFFLSRFREALSHFQNQYDMLDTFIDRENTDRIVLESEIFGKAVMNIVACEEMNVVERVDRYKQSYAVTKGAGFEQIPLNQGVKQEVQKILKSWHKEYMVTEDLDYLLMGWKGRTLHAMGAWKGLKPIKGMTKRGFDHGVMPCGQC